MKNLKLLIIMLSIFAIGLLTVIIVLNIQNKQKTNTNTIINNTVITNTIANNTTGNTTNIAGDAPVLSINKELQKATDNSTLYSISNNINKYFNYIKENNTQAVNELGGNNLYNIQNNVKYVVKEAYTTENRNMAKYYTYGILTIANGDYTATEQEIYMIVYLTAENKGYMVQTISQEEYQNRQALEEDDKVDITQGTYNLYEYEYINNVKQMEIYLQDYVFRVFNNTEKSYELLNEEYRNKRFGNLEQYIKFLNEKIGQLQDIKITQYNIDDSGLEKVYKGTDENGNYYQIAETAYMEYELILDDYTMEDYSKEDTEEKIKKSAQKFILMINSADYTNAYNLLDETFRNTNFPTEQDFINYVKNNWFKRNIIASKEVTDEGICIVTMKETLSTNSNKIQKQFRVTLGDGMKFTIQFDV